MEYILFRKIQPDKHLLSQIYGTMNIIQNKFQINFSSKWEDENTLVVYSNEWYNPEEFEKQVELENRTYPIFWSDDYSKMRYLRRLAQNFLTYELPDGGNVFLIVDHTNVKSPYFLYFHLTEISGNEFQPIWDTYYLGGLIRPLYLTSDQVESAMKIFRWSERHSFQINGEILQMNVRHTCFSEFEQRIVQIVSNTKLVINQMNDKIILLSDDSGVGLIKWIQDMYPNIQIIIPIIGTNVIYTDQPLPLDFRPPDAIDPWDGNEPYTGETYSIMDPFWIYGLYQKLSPIGVWKGFQYGHPTTRALFNPDVFQDYTKMMNVSCWLVGLLDIPPPIEIKSVFYSGFDWICLSTLGRECLILKIPHLTDPDNLDIYNLANEILSKAYSTGTLFKQPRYYWPDLLLTLTPEVLDIVEESLSVDYPTNVEEQIQRLLHDMYLLAKVSR